MLQMKKVFKWGLVVLGILAVLIAAVVGGYMYKLNSQKTDNTPPTFKISSTAKTIILEANDKSGILHIGYCWDDEQTTAENVTNKELPIPESEGPHTLHFYAKDNSPQINATGWFDYTVVVQPKAE